MPDSTSKPPVSASNRWRPRSFALRFISGKYQGGEVPLSPQREVVVGRASDLEMVLVEDMVSRRHARFAFDGETIEIEDLGSTNGTFVNGEKVRRAVLREGDRVLIGTSILKVVVVEAGSAGDRPREPLETVASRQGAQSTRTMSGLIEEIPLPDLMQLLSTSKKNGVLEVRTEREVGKVFFRKGQIYFASVNDDLDIAPLKALFRLLLWQKGEFSLEAADEATFANEIDVSVPELLMEGLRHLDEMAVMREKLPDFRAKVVVPVPLVPPMRELSADDLDVLQLAHNLGTVGAVLDRSDKLDLDTAEVLVRLFKKGYLASA